MATRYEIETEPEVLQWLSTISDKEYARVEAHADHLADHAETLGEPFSRHLGGKLRELRIRMYGQQVRITYWLAPGRRIVLLTVFRKTKMRETDQIERARRAQKACEAGHPPAHTIWSR